MHTYIHVLRAGARIHTRDMHTYIHIERIIMIFEIKVIKICK